MEISFPCLPAPWMVPFSSSYFLSISWGLGKSFYLMLWGIQLSDLCIVDLCTACGGDISSVKMYIGILIFQSINNYLLCSSGPPRTWRAIEADMLHQVTSFQMIVSLTTQLQWQRGQLWRRWLLTLTLMAAGGGRDNEGSQQGWDLFLWRNWSLLVRWVKHEFL